MDTKFTLLGLLVLVVVSGMSIQSAYADLTFNLDEIAQLRIVGEPRDDGFESTDSTSFDVEDIECRLKHTTTIFFADGSNSVTQSSGLFGSPILNSFLSPQGKEVIRFAIVPYVFCGGAFSGTVHAGIDRDGQENIIVLRVFANLPNGNQIQVHAEQTETVSTQFRSGDPNELPFAVFHVTAQNIYDSLPDEDYNVTLRFEQTGNISFIQSTAEFIDSGKSMFIVVNPTQIQSFYSGQNHIDIPLDTDGDGIPDSGDQCPTVKETFNGFQDSDGCPDTPPLDQCPTGQIRSLSGICITDPNYIPPENETEKEPTTPNGMTESQCIAMEGGTWSTELVFGFLTVTTVGKCTIIDEPPTGTTKDCFGFPIPINQECIEQCVLPKKIINGVCQLPTDTRNCDGVQIPINDFCPSDCPDSDGDDICDFVDDCTFEPETVNGFQDDDGCADVCPENTNSNGQCVPFDMCPVQISCSSGLVFSGLPDCDCVSDGTLTAEEFRKQIGDGRIVPITTVVYSDGSNDLFIGSSGSGSVFPSIGDITPALLTGSTTGDKPKQVDRIDFTLYYISSSELNTSDLSVSKSSGFGIKPTVILSSVQQQGGTVHPLIGGSQSATFGSLPQGIGHGAKLGSISFSAKDIEQIGILAGIGEGNQRDVTLNFETLGQLQFTKSLLNERFNISDNYVQFSDFIIFNEKNVTVDCSKLNPPQVPNLDSQGNQIGCKPSVDPNADDDGDGIINSQDQCPDEQEDGLQPKPFDGCKTGSTPPTQTCPDNTVIPVNEICTQLCSNGSTIPVTQVCPTNGGGGTHTCPDGTVIPIGQVCGEICIPQLSLVSPCDPTITCDDPKSLWASPALYEATCNPEPDVDLTLLAYAGIALVFVAIIIVIIKRR